MEAGTGQNNGRQDIKDIMGKRTGKGLRVFSEGDNDSCVLQRLRPDGGARQSSTISRHKTIIARQNTTIANQTPQ